MIRAVIADMAWVLSTKKIRESFLTIMNSPEDDETFTLQTKCNFPDGRVGIL